MGLGTFDKLPSGKWRGRVMVNGRRHTITKPTKREAQQAVADVIAAADPATRRRRRRDVTVADHLDVWLGEHTDRLAPSTAVDYRRAIDSHIRPHLGDLALTDLHQTDLNDLYRTLQGSGLGAVVGGCCVAHCPLVDAGGGDVEPAGQF